MLASDFVHPPSVPKPSATPSATSSPRGRTLEQLEQAGDTLTAEQKKAFSAKYDERMKAVGAKMMPGLQRSRAR